MRRNYGKEIVAALDKLPNSTLFCLFLVTFVAGARLLGEWLVLDGRTQVTFVGFVHQACFYLAMFVLNVNNLSLILRQTWTRFYGVVGVGILLGVLPVILDSFIPGVKERYQYFQSFPLWLAASGQPIGETITLWIWIMVFSAYIYLFSGSLRKTLLGVGFTYLTILFTGWLSWILKRHLLEAALLKLNGDYSWAMWWLVIALAITVVRNWAEFKSVFGRIQHALVWGGLVLLGSKLVGFVDSMSWWRAFIMSLSFLFIMLVNDYYDKDTDRINQRESGITWEMTQFVIYCHILLVLVTGFLDIVLGVLSLLFFILGLAYSSTVIRLKRHFLLGSLVEGLGAVICLFAGGTQFGLPMSKWFVPVTFVFGLGFMAASNFKDYKDVKGDSVCSITTLYVWLQGKGWAIQKTNLLINAVVVVALLVPGLMLYLLNAGAGVISLTVAAAVTPSLIMTTVKNPKIAVSFGVWSIIIYLMILVEFMPRLPI